MGKAYAFLNDPEKAEKNFLKVIHLSPIVDQGYMNLGFLYEMKGHTSMAVWAYKKALIQNPQNKRVRERLEFLAGN
jgi:Tfp pilus assembly protein PilF